jgi:hypothetical protein
MKDSMNPEARLLIDLTKRGITARSLRLEESLDETKQNFFADYQAEIGLKIPKDLNWHTFYTLADHHAVLPLLYDVLKSVPEVPPAIWKLADQKSVQTVGQSYHLLFLTSYLVKLMEKQGIKVVVVKGSSIAAAYPVPELRKSGDIDLLFPREEDFHMACGVLSRDGFKQETAMISVYHRSFFSPEGIDIELHYHMAKPFDDERVNRTLDAILSACQDHLVRMEVMGVSLPVLSSPYQAFYLLLHMLHHFLGKGFGLKLLCDWVVFWNHSQPDSCKEQFLTLTDSVGFQGFARMISKVCTDYLGLHQENISFLHTELISDEGAAFMIQEILEAEEFGKSQNDRMVVVRGKGLPAYFREFHHQMLLNHKQTGKYKILWPILWMITLVMFLYRNKKLRKVSTRAILASAGKRSKLLREMDLF